MSICYGMLSKTIHIHTTLKIFPHLKIGTFFVWTSGGGQIVDPFVVNFTNRGFAKEFHGGFAGGTGRIVVGFVVVVVVVVVAAAAAWRRL